MTATQTHNIDSHASQLSNTRFQKMMLKKALKNELINAKAN